VNFSDKKEAYKWGIVVLIGFMVLFNFTKLGWGSDFSCEPIVCGDDGDCNPAGDCGVGECDNWFFDPAGWFFPGECETVAKDEECGDECGICDEASYGCDYSSQEAHELCDGAKCCVDGDCKEGECVINVRSESTCTQNGSWCLWQTKNPESGNLKIGKEKLPGWW
jgi:hypothetical protein